MMSLLLRPQTSRTSSWATRRSLFVLPSSAILRVLRGRQQQQALSPPRARRSAEDGVMSFAEFTTVPGLALGDLENPLILSPPGSSASPASSAVNGWKLRSLVSSRHGTGRSAEAGRVRDAIRRAIFERHGPGHRSAAAVTMDVEVARDDSQHAPGSACR